MIITNSGASNGAGVEVPHLAFSQNDLFVAIWKLSQNIIIGLYSILDFLHAFHSKQNTDFDALNSRK